MTEQHYNVLFDRFEVLQTLGSGSFAEVFKVKDRESGEFYALKVLRSPDEEMIRRLHQEAQIQAELKHPNVCQVLEVFVVETELAVVMEYIDGVPMTELLRNGGSLQLDDALLLFEQLVAAIASAHEAGVVHRDLNPDNVLIVENGQAAYVKVIDFGLAKAIRDSGVLTQTGTSMGMPGYCAPEQQVDSSRVGFAADTFSLSCLLYEMVCGKPAFFRRGDSLSAILNSMEGVYDPVLALAPNCPPQIVTALEKGLQPEVDARFQNCDELAQGVFGRRFRSQPEALPSAMLHQMAEPKEPATKAAPAKAPAAAAPKREPKKGWMGPIYNLFGA